MMTLDDTIFYEDVENLFTALYEVASADNKEKLVDLMSSMRKQTLLKKQDKVQILLKAVTESFG